jgi:hypothetical protein
MSVYQFLLDEYDLSDIFVLENDSQLVYIINNAKPPEYEALVFDQVPTIHDKSYRLPILKDIRQI